MKDVIRRGCIPVLQLQAITADVKIREGRYLTNSPPPPQDFGTAELLDRHREWLDSWAEQLLSSQAPHLRTRAPTRSPPHPTPHTGSHMHTHVLARTHTRTHTHISDYTQCMQQSLYINFM